MPGTAQQETFSNVQPISETFANVQPISDSGTIPPPAPALPGASPRLLQSPAAAGATPTQFERERNPANQPGFLRTLGSDLGSMVTAPIQTLLSKEGWTGNARGNPNFDPSVVPPPVAPPPGSSAPYRALTKTARAVGINPTPMEQASDVGNRGAVLGHATAQAAPYAAPLAIEAAMGGASALHGAAMEDPTVAAARAMADPKFDALKGQAEAAQARPYLAGAKNLADLQSRIPIAKAEVWQHMQDALNQVGGNVVHGPDGPMPVSYYEAERLKNTALLDTARSMRPGDMATVLQRDTAVAQMTARDAAIKAAIDPELIKTGIDPQLVRNTYGALSGVQDSVEGRSTLLEPPRRYGLGRIADIDVSKPVQALGSATLGVGRDLIAGRPVWSGAPTDVAVREGFRDTGEPKPNLRPFTPTIQQGPQIRGLLPQGALIPPPPGPSATSPPQPTYLGTRAERLGLLLPSAGSAAPAYQGGGIPTPIRMDALEPLSPPPPVLSREPGPISSPPSNGSTPREIFVRPSSSSRFVVGGGATPLPPELHADLERQAGRPLSHVEANLLDRANLERQMAAGSANPDETATIRAANKQTMEQMDPNRYGPSTAIPPPPSAAETQHALVNEMAKYNVVPGRTLSRQEVTKAQTILGMASKLEPYEVTERLHKALGLPPPPL